MKKIILAIMLTALIVFFLIACDISSPDSHEEKFHSISGKVLDHPTDNPVAGHGMQMWPGDYFDQFDEVIRYTQTDSLGNYSFSNLEDGEYTVFCEAVVGYYSYGNWWRTIEIDGKNITDLNFWRCYWWNC